MDFYQMEAQDAVRFVWNNIPNTKLTATRAVLPIGIHYTPYKDLENLAVVEYEPLKCRCGVILNPYCQVDFRTKTWICPFCSSRIQFPANYAQYISEQNLPAELMQNYSTIEYVSQQAKQIPNIYLILIDTCVPIEELNAMRDSIQQSLNIIPPETYVGLITFSRFVYVHEIGFTECPKSHAFKGSKEYTSIQIQEMLGLSIKNDPRGTASIEAIKKYLMPISDCEFTLNSILDDLQPDPWVVPGDERNQRASGCALNVALSLLEACPFTGSRLMMFIGGPCTIGPGQVVGIKLQETMRAYLDISKDNENCKYMKKTQKYYQTMAQKAVKAQIVVDLYAFSVDQFGLLEMKCLTEKSGGYLIMNEEFNSDVFKQTYKKVFATDVNKELNMCTSAKIDVFVSKELKLSGALGQCSSLKKQNSMVSEVEIGQSGTSQWFLGGIDRCTTISFILDYGQQQKETNNSKCAYFQFQTQFKAPNGKQKLRVTTVVRQFANGNNKRDLEQGFDQEAASVLMARLGILRAENEEPIEVLKWLDRTLIRLVTKFADFKREDPASFRLNKEFQLYPQFMYHLRRSHFIQTFGASPDEITFYRSTLSRESVTNCVVMIQPALLSYTFNQTQPKPVLLDLDSMKNDVVLLLDTYFQVVVWYGDHIQQWKNKGYDQQEEYANFKELLESPQEDVKMIMEDRFPVPIYFLTYPGHTKERYLKSRVNPSSHNLDIKESGHYITDDASMKLFMEHLVKIVVTQQQ